MKVKLSKPEQLQRKLANKQKKEFIQETFFLLLDQVNVERPVPEHQFHSIRKWKFDYAWKEQMIALEVEGGVHIQGRHSRGAGMEKDMEKYNEATVMGWRILKVVPSKLCSFNTISMLRRILIFN